jgi:hypothetical protein
MLMANTACLPYLQSRYFLTKPGVGSFGTLGRLHCTRRQFDDDEHDRQAYQHAKGNESARAQVPGGGHRDEQTRERDEEGGEWKAHGARVVRGWGRSPREGSRARCSPLA